MSAQHPTRGTPDPGLSPDLPADHNPTACRRIYVASPYRGDIAANVALARRACRRLLLAGHAPFAPHLLYPQLLDDAVPAERRLGLAAGRAWLGVADEVRVYGEISPGMREELEDAALLGLPIYFEELP